MSQTEVSISKTEPNAVYFLKRLCLARFLLNLTHRQELKVSKT